ncbi:MULTISPECIES: response regulator [unclassified Pseudomonas]|uniref:response regulator n=1 Tax=unclassified Pseudomonas TaxID=196821 RepID=UPI0035C212EE
MLNAMIVDDHPFIRSAVRMVLKQQHYDVVAEAGNGADAVQLAREHKPNLMVLDISMPGVDGMGALGRITDLRLPIKVIILTALCATFFSMRCMRAGASGYVSKGDDLDELVKAIDAIKAGYTFFPDLAMSSVRHDDAYASETAMIQRLSDRELSIFQQLAHGFSNQEIADKMLLSSKTISTYKARIIDKLKLKSLVHLAEFAKRNNLI